jgi:hypothetical protein
MVKSVVGERKKLREGNGDGRKMEQEKDAEATFGPKPGLPTPIDT